MPVLPMFPLGTVLFPGMVLPLHVFEQRYRAMVEHCLAGTGEFGVVLIARGSEVGGADLRTDVGTVAQIVDGSELADGRWVLVTAGTRRVRVIEWLPDDPFPMAEVQDWPDPEPVDDLHQLYADCVRTFRRVLALGAELGLSVPPSTIEVDNDPTSGALQLSALAPFGPLDQQRLLAAASPEQRMADLQPLLEDEAQFLERRLTLG